MKKFLTIIITALVLQGCLNEGDSGCPGDMTLRFLYDDSTQGFDAEIGNDVHLFIYGDGVLKIDEVIPYSLIRGGNPYALTKRLSGDLRVVAWAVPTDGNYDLLPKAQINEAVEDRLIELEGAGSTYTYHPLGNLYMGSVQFIDEMTENSTHNINLTNCICKVNVTVYDNIGMFPVSRSDDEPLVQIEGSKSTMDLDFKPAGDDAIVVAELNPTPYEVIPTFQTEQLGLLPSDSGQTLVVTVLKGDTPVFRLDTEERSRPDTEIDIEIVLGSTATIIVNGYRVRTVTVEQL